MGRWLSIIIIVAILVGGGGYLWQQKADEEARAKIESSLVDARRSFAEQGRSAITEDDEEDYLQRVRTALSSYEDELKKRVYDERTEWRDVEAYAKEVETRFEEGKLQEVQRKSMLEGFQIVKEAYQTLKKGNWKPLLTQVGAGDTRLDIYEMRRIRDDDGNPLLEGRFFFWGIEDNTRINWGQLTLRYWHTVDKQVKKGRRRVTEEVEEVLGRAEGDATPRIIIQNPSNYIAEFPSYVSVGYVWLPVMPREAEKFDLTITYTVRKGGGSYDAELEWDKLPIPSRWQLKEGEVWEADVVEATKEEIAGKDDDEEVDAGTAPN